MDIAPQNQSGTLCPAVKAADIIGDKWVLLILRELFLGATRFRDFERALPRISPTILSARLKKLEKDGLIIRKSSPANKTLEYRLTKCGRELGPIIAYMATWGLRWARRRVCDDNLDVGSFMWDFHRTLKTEELPDGETVLCVQISDQTTHKTWWVIANGQKVDLCTDDPAKTVDLYITAKLESFVEIWMGDKPVNTAIDDKTVLLSGEPYLETSVSDWFPRSSMSHIRPERPIA